MSVLEMIYGTPAGKFVARKAGLAEPPKLRRGRVLPTGPIVLGELEGAGIVRDTLALIGVSPGQPIVDTPSGRVKDDKGRDVPPSYQSRPGALLIDATGVSQIAQLEDVRALLRPVMRSLEASGRIVIVARDASTVEGLEAKAVSQAMDGINRTVGKELRGGATSNLVLLTEGARPSDLASTLSFLLEGRSAFVDGQTWRVGRASVTHELSVTPFRERVVVVTGAARGIGAAIARTFARDGAVVVAVDMPSAGDALARVANEIGGSALQLDITSADAGQRIVSHVSSRHGQDARIWAIVHNAGITRDKMLANLDERLWAAVLDVNLAAEMRINDHLLTAGDMPGGLGEEARLVGIASTSGVAGNKGQTNYAASKAGVMGYVWALSEELGGRPVTINAVAPGFIETEMTAAIPFISREIFRRTNSLGQGGSPVDVAETLAYLCGPSSGGVDGQVVRVCGQNLIGA